MSRNDYYYEKNAPIINAIVPAASAILTDNEGRILMHKRVDNDRWSLLGGAMDCGESIEEAIIREIKEESGYEAEVMKLIGIYTNPNHIISYSDGEVRQQFSVCFHCKVKSGSLLISEESKKLQFFSLNEIKNLNLHESQMIRVLDYLEFKDNAFIR